MLSMFIAKQFQADSITGQDFGLSSQDIEFHFRKELSMSLGHTNSFRTVTPSPPLKIKDMSSVRQTHPSSP